MNTVTFGNLSCLTEEKMRILRQIAVSSLVEIELFLLIFRSFNVYKGAYGRIVNGVNSISYQFIASQPPFVHSVISYPPFIMS